MRRSIPAGVGAGLVLLGVGAFLFPGAIFRGEVFYDRDIHLEWYSQVEGFVRAVASGAWPIWDNTIGFGESMLADPSSQICYPPSWLNLILPPWRYYTLFAFGHLVFAALGVVRLGRRFGLPLVAGLAAATVWVTSGPMVSIVNLWHHFAGACWMPWVLDAALRAARSRRPGRTVVWALVQAGQILAGSADMVAMTLALTMLVLVPAVRWRRPFHPWNLSLVARAGAAVALALGLTAFLWLPTLEAASRSERAELPQNMRTTWSVHPMALFQSLLPLFPGDAPLAPGVAAAFLETGRTPLLASLYLGVGTLGFAGAAFLSPRRRLRALLIVALAGSLLVALGHHAPFYEALVTLPPLGFLRYPSKAMIVAALSWSMLVGLGVEAWARGEARRGFSFVVALCLAVALLAAAMAAVLAFVPGLAAFTLAEGTQSLDSLRAIARGLVLPAFVAVAATAAALRRRAVGASPSLAAGVAALAVVDLLVAHRPLNPTAPAELVAFRPPVIDVVRDGEGGRLYAYEYFLTAGSARRYLGRDDPYVILPPPGVPRARAQLLSLRLYPFPPSAARWGVEGSFDVDTRGLFPLPLARLSTLLRAVEATPAHDRLLRLGAVRYVVALHTRGFEGLEAVRTLPSLFPEPIRVFRVGNPLPRAYAVSGARVADGDTALRLLVDPEFDPAREVVLASGPPRPPRTDFRGSCRLVSLRADRVAVDAELSDAGYVVLVDTHDPGWRVAVDGERRPLLRANVAFRAVEVPAGRHRIEFLYRPVSALIGLGVASASAVVVTVALWRGRRRR